MRTAKAAGKLTIDDVNNYLKKRLLSINNMTARNNRILLLGLWKYAYENNLIDHLPRNIVKIKATRNLPKLGQLKSVMI